MSLAAASLFFYDDLSNEIDNVENQVQSLQYQYYSLSTAVNTLVESGGGSASQQITQINNEISNLNTEVSNLNTQVATFSTQLSSLNTQVTNLDSQVSSLNTQVTTLDSEVTTLQGDVTTINGEITNINSDITTMQAQIAALQAAVGAGGIVNLDFDGTFIQPIAVDPAPITVPTTVVTQNNFTVNPANNAVTYTGSGTANLGIWVDVQFGSPDSFYGNLTILVNGVATATKEFNTDFVQYQTFGLEYSHAFVAGDVVQVVFTGTLLPTTLNMRHFSLLIK